MFGYVIANQAELKFKEYDLYRSYYCGFCRSLKKRYGVVSQFTLSYDMTFLILLLSDLYDTQDETGFSRCLAHPFQKHPTRTNIYTEYAADMNVILSYYSCLDDWTDEKKLHKLAFASLLQGKEKKAAVSYGKKAAVVKDRLDKLHEAEAAGSTDIDLVSGYFGEIMAEIFAVNEDEWESSLRRIGFYLGKFIYICDAWDDIESDIRSGSYNPLKDLYAQGADRVAFDEYCHSIMTMMMARCCEIFEALPCIENVEILRNILYSGVWTRYNAVQAQREKKEAAND